MEIIKYLDDSKVIIKKDDGKYALRSFFKGIFYEDLVVEYLEDLVGEQE